MLEPILKGLVEWIYEMMLDIMSYASGELIGVMDMDLTYFEDTAPIISDIVDVFIALGWALLIGNLVFQALKIMMSGAGFEAEDPKILFIRTFVFSFLLLASPEICRIGSSIASTVIGMLDLPDSIEVTTPDEDMFSLGSGAKWLLVIIVGVVLMVQMVKLLFEIGERYVITSVLTYFAPLAFAMGGSKNTNDIFKGWCRMYASMLVMMIMNIVFLKLIMSAMAEMAEGGVLVWLVFVVALTRVARKIDSHIGKLGLNPAQTGNALGSRIPGMMTAIAIRSMGSLFSKSAANAKGGSGGRGGRSTGSRNHNRNPNMYGSRPNAYGGGTTNNMGYGDNTVNAGGPSTYSYGDGINVNKGGPNSTQNNQNAPGMQNNSGPTNRFSGPNSERPRYSPNAPHIGRKDTHPIHNGVLQNDTQNTHNDIEQDNATPTRPPIPRNTAGKYPPGVNPMMSVKNGGMPINGNPNISSPITQQEFTASTKQDGGKTIIDSDVVHSTSDINSKTSRGGIIYGTQYGGNMGGTHISGETVNGSPQIYSDHSSSEHFSDRNTEHFRDSQIKSLRQSETTERRINHEYKHGRFNPAAANKKVKKSYYQKDNPLGYRQNAPSSKKRGDRNRNKRW